MDSKIKIPWLEVGYTIFSVEGPKGLKIEVLAREVGKSKSSFYHCFADLELFIEELLEFHEVKSNEIFKKIQLCENFVPDVFEVLFESKEDAFFSRQLRINRHLEAYKNCFEKAHKPVEDALFEFWPKAIGLEDKPQLAKMILTLTVDNFYLRLTEETFTDKGMKSYLDEIIALTKEI
jgi:AcrR family transcriptional regulator|tara:strand:+ start:317 stop:850 length:534 start_codon:yes stop_codon:yes gene_type:complete